MTIRQIAESLGVAPSTVSVVLNSRPGVRNELRDKIKEELLKNGYSLKDTKSTKGNILFIYYRSTDYLAARKDDTISTILSGMEKVCLDSRYTFSVTNATPENLDEILDNATDENHCGIILLGTEYYQKPSPSFFRTTLPFVILDGFFPEQPLNTVNIDNSAGVYQAISHLIEHNHKKIGYLKSTLEFGCLLDRKNYIFSTLEKFKISLDPSKIINVSQESHTIRQEVSDYLKATADIPTAFIADNDIIAVSAIQVFQSFGYRVPEDISIIGFDDSNICTILTPNLTTVRADFLEMSKLATKRLIEMIEESEDKIIKSTVGVALIKRQTVDLNKE